MNLSSSTEFVARINGWFSQENPNQVRDLSGTNCLIAHFPTISQILDCAVLSSAKKKSF